MRDPSEVKKLLRENGITQEAVALSLGYSITTINQALFGKKPHIFEEVDRLIDNEYIINNRKLLGNMIWKTCPNIQNEVNKVERLMGKWLETLSADDESDWIIYNEATRKATQYIAYNYYGLIYRRETPLIILQESLELDHRYSIREGFRNKISPIILSIPFNLQYLTKKVNCSKGDRCDIRLERLLEKYKETRELFPRTILVGSRPLLQTPIIPPLSLDEAMLKRSHYINSEYRKYVKEKRNSLVIHIK